MIGLSSERPFLAGVGDAHLVEGDSDVVAVGVVELNHDADDVRGFAEIL